MGAPSSSNQPTKHSVQHIKNLSFDDEFGVQAVELLGYDSGAGVLRRLKVDSNGQVVVSASALDHGSLGGLTDDDHTQYFLLAGRNGDVANLIQNNITTTTTQTLALQNTTAATVGVPVQYSPALDFIGHGLLTLGSQDRTIRFRQELRPVNGTPTGTLAWMSSVDTGTASWTDRMTLTSAGLLSVTNLAASALTSGRVTYATTGGQLTDDADFTFNGSQLALATQGSTGGLLVGGDAQWFRGSTNRMDLASGDSLYVVSGSVGINTAPGSTVALNSQLSTSTDSTQHAVNALLTVTGTIGGSSFPVAMVGRYDVNAAANTVAYAVGLNGQVRVATGQSGTVSNVVGTDCFVWDSSTNGATITNFYGGSFTASIQASATGSITNARGGSFGTFHNQDATVSVTTNTWMFAGGNIPGGGITTNYGVLVNTAARTSGLCVNFYGIYIDNLVAVTANNDLRIGLRIDPMPTAGAFTGTTIYALDIAGTSGTIDGIRFGLDNEATLYRTAADTLATVGGFVGNESGGDFDFRVEGDTLTHMIFADASSATENIALLTGSIPNWQTMDGGIYIGNATTAPTGNPSTGGFMYATGGAGTWRGSSGTVTTFGPAEPHCPRCGRDFAWQWQNDEKGWGKLSLCAYCLTQALARVGVGLEEYVI